MTYFSESVSLSLTIKFGYFTGTRDNNTHYLYSVCTDSAFCFVTYYIGVGYCLFVPGSRQMPIVK